jgi:hypothetical protein
VDNRFGVFKSDMRLNASQNWFKNSAQQSVFMKAASLPVVARSGPSSPHTESSGRSDDGKFIAGKSLVDGKDVVT